MLSATYRVQLTPEFGFRALREALPYLHSLGVSHLYLSPVFQSRAGSTHGYDVTDHSRLDEELGGRREFDELSRACRERGMGLVLDIVPNHMALGPQNQWWADVLENGPASRFAGYFDIDWEPSRSSMRNRLLVPVLSAPLGEVIDSGALSIAFMPESGSFQVRHADLAFPLEPRSYALVFSGRPGAVDIHEEAARQEFCSLLDAFAALPPPVAAAPEVLQQRDRDRQVNQRRLARLCAREPVVREFIERTLQQVNASPEQVAGVLQAQPYRLAFWRVSGEEVNYRRFFDVNELAALRVEEPEVFASTHGLVRELMQSAPIDGIRVDHADGLYDPERYFGRLRDLVSVDGQRPWIIAEKILAAGEELAETWCVDGSTGYEFGALVTAWLARGPGLDTLRRIYRRYVQSTTPYAEIVYQSKKLVMRSSLAAEISMLAIRLDRLAQLHRHTSDFTLFDLRQAIVEVIACFPVYRTYIAADRLTAEDVQHVRRAIGMAFSRKQSARRALEFLQRVLLGEFQDDPARAEAAIQFTQRFQQVTGPVMAKGVEDTAFYRYASFLPMNEVGADPDGRAIHTEILHRANEARLRDWPRCMLSTSTHDSKRGEDVRFRLCVLSEQPQAWADCLGRWRKLKRRRHGADPAAAVQEYLLLQSLLGIWPAAGPADIEALGWRLGEYAIKAAREGKELTSWLDPDPDAETALQDLVNQMLPGPAAGFERYFREIIDRVAYFGLLNSLTAVTLKFTAPGIPDVYQGTELPALTLVDPDNRRTVQMGEHAAALAQIDARLGTETTLEVVQRLLADWRDGHIKLFLTATLLRLRRSVPDVFAGDYLVLPTEGSMAAHLCAFARIAEGGALVTVVSRWAATLAEGAMQPPLGGVWRDTTVLVRGVPPGRYTDVFTGREHEIQSRSGEDFAMQAAALFEALPVAVLARRAA